jgi:2-polyprenylphenol 6-hydroxylase
MSGRTDFDVIIVGGGPVGACAGALLARSTGAKLCVAVVEESPPEWPAPDAAPDLRVSACSRASERILGACAAWERIQPWASPYERMRVWHEDVPADGPGVLEFDAAEAGEPNLGYIIENRRVTAALLASFVEAGGQLIRAGFQGVQIPTATHAVTQAAAQTATQAAAQTATQAATQTVVPTRPTAMPAAVQVNTTAGPFTARLLVGADGAHSAVRQAIGLTAGIIGYGQRAIVARVSTQRGHERTAWQRFLSAGTLAFLPLADGSSSIVWSVGEEEAERLLAATASDFEQALQQRSGGVLGVVRLLSQRVCFPLQRLAARSYTAERCALIGDAAHVVHPLAGQGLNLGLLDAAALAEQVGLAVTGREDPGARRVLRAYERWRKSDNLSMQLAIDGFNRFLAHDAGLLSVLARSALPWVNRSVGLKRLFMSHASGVAGELPRAARVTD